MNVKRRLVAHAPALVVAACGAAGALAMRALVFPSGSPNLDELGYLSQADALRHGMLTLPAATHQPYFMPYLSGVHGDQVVFKYQPLWPAFLALVRAVSGSYVPAIALVAFAASLAAYWLAYEVTLNRRIAVTAAVIGSLSPFVLVQASTYLAYLASSMLLCTFAALTLRAMRFDSSTLFVGAGLFLGAACFHRTYDGVLWALCLIPLVAVAKVPWRRKVRQISLLTLGAVPFLVMFLAYNQAVMGSPLVPAFESSGPIDTFGFGDRASFVVAGRPGALDFTSALSMRAMGSYFHALGLFSFGAWLLMGLVLVGVVRCRAERYSGLLVALALSFPLGYFFWWGVANSVQFDLHRLIGPFYWLPMMPPLAVIAARGLADITRLLRSRAPSGSTTGVVYGMAPFAVLILVTLGLAPGLLRPTRQAGRDRAHVVSSERRTGPARTLVFVPPEFPGDPYVRTVVPSRLTSADHLVALDVDSGRGRLPLLNAMPDRTPYALLSARPAGRIFDPPRQSLRRLEVRTGERLRIQVRVTVPSAWQRAEIYTRDRAHTVVRAETLNVEAGQVLGAAVTLAPEGDRRADVAVRDSGRSIRFAVGVRFSNGSKAGTARTSYECNWELGTALRRSAAVLQLVDPPLTRHFYVFTPDRKAWSTEDVSPVLRCSS